MATLAALIAEAYPSPQWAVFYEVANATGFNARRHADAVALGIWPSRGHRLVGFEFKESRRDWQRERRQPAKAEEIARFVDEWWLVVGDDKVAKLDEIPDPWGLLVATPQRDALVRRKMAVPFPDRDPNAPLPRSFVGAMLRRVGETMIHKDAAAKQLEDAITKDAAGRQAASQAERLRLELEAATRALDAFQAATGINLRNGWQGPDKIGAAVDVVLRSEAHRQALEMTKTRFAGVVAELCRALDAWPSPAAPAAQEEEGPAPCQDTRTPQDHAPIASPVIAGPVR